MTGMVAAAALGRAKALLGGAIVPALIAALIAAALWGWLGNRRADKWERVAGSTKTALDRQIVAHGNTNLALLALTKATRAQTAMVRTLVATSETQQSAAQEALRQARARGRGLEVSAQRIDAQRAQRASGGQICPTSEAVMAARGEL